MSARSRTDKRDTREILSDTRCLIFVEGHDDRNILKAFYQQQRDKLTLVPCQFMSLDGRDKIKSRITAKNPDFGNLTSIGIILDAENSAEKTRQSANNALQNNDKLTDIFGYFPNFSKNNEVVSCTKAASTLRKVGLFIIADESGKSGKLEDLILRFIEKERPKMWKCIQDFHKCEVDEQLKPQKEPQKEDDPSKRMAQTFLSGLPIYTQYVGKLAHHIDVDSPYIDFASPIFDELRTFLADLAKPAKPA